MTLRDLMARHARTTLVRADHHGETVTYRFKDPEIEARELLAVVDRRDLTPAAPGVPQIQNRTALVFFARHATLGVEAITPGDKIELAMRIGDEPVAARIVRIVNQDESSFLVEVCS